ncbi:UDP-glycosyltransferase phosphorylase [Coleophoma cylindrospora]|uniref:UDP-glycosyltransferase phosphorylase n=1 Tax=Coleophoma cylindrospora TaxID=1849047 RepID=A0A3D8SEQ5_9HELO|nr:UDP-glycosyltransferase phosphorylase [Coleophoma cylindrospora]
MADTSPHRQYRHLNMSNRFAHSKVQVLRDGRFSLHTNDHANRLQAYLEKRVKKRPLGGQVRRKTQKKDPIDYKAVLGSYEGLPRINIAIHIVGSRGDVQPFIPIAQALSKPPYSHRVRICTHPVFKDLVEENGIEFFSIGGDPANLMAYMVKNPGLMPGMESLRAGDVGKRRVEMAQIMDGAWRSCIESGNGLPEDANVVRTRKEEDMRLFIADAIIANPPSYAHVHCAEKLSIPLQLIFTMPWSPTQAFPHPLANIEPSNVDPSITNYLSYSMMELLAWQGLGDIITRFRVKTLNLDPISPLWGHLLLSRMKVPFTYLWSQELIPKPKDWGPHINIAGFSFLPLASSYQPPDDLMAFLNAGPPPVYIGFGSIVVDHPAELTRTIFGAIKRTGIRAIVSKGWGGLGEDTPPEGVFMLGNCPHDWLFQYVSCVVHHGGAGTTAIGLAMGKPTVVVPFFGDQPFWGAMVFRAGAGPEPVPYKKMTEETLAHSISLALGPEIQAAAESMGKMIVRENPGAAEAARYFSEAIDLSRMRCFLSPERVAVWRIKKSNVQLSNVAVSALMAGGHLSFEHIKLIRHIDWYVDEGAEGPSTGVLGAVSETVLNMVMNIADYCRGLSRTLHEDLEKGNKDSFEIARAKDAVHGDAMDPDTLHTIPTRIHIQPADTYPHGRLEYIAYRMASKTARKADKKKRRTWKQKQLDKQAQEFSRSNDMRSTVEHKHGKIHGVAHETRHFAGSMIGAGLKAPVAFFYNLANGCHNLPSYAFGDDTVRRRDKITGFGSGIKAATKGYGLNMYDGITGLVTQPYLGAKKGGAAGFGKGVGRAIGGLLSKTLAAQFGLLGYTLKGIEKQVGKRGSRNLKARLIAIRLRQGLLEYENASEEEKALIMDRWNKISQAQHQT